METYLWEKQEAKQDRACKLEVRLYLWVAGGICGVVNIFIKMVKGFSLLEVKATKN